MIPRLAAGGLDALRAAGAEVIIVSDRAGWALDDQASGVAASLRSRRRATVVGRIPGWLRGRILHFFNRYAALERDDLHRLASRNKVIVSWTHGGPSSEGMPGLRTLAARFTAVAASIHRVHVSATMYLPVVAALGVDPDRIRCVPFAIHTGRYLPEIGRDEARRRLGLAHGRPIIGSFQRDGEVEPKLVKGPDRFVELVERVRRSGPDVEVLLTGPARGFVRRELAAREIPFTYLGVLPPETVPVCYRACDVYAITSREEGGPLALLESMASGVPVVSTPVGMVVDLVEDGANGMIADDVAELADRAVAILADADLGRRLSAEARRTVAAYDWEVVGRRYENELYA